MKPEAEALKVTAHLVTPLAGEAPQLDALLEWALSPHHKDRLQALKADRRCPAPPVGSIPIPIPRRMFGGWNIACSSAPILDVSASTVEYISKKLSVENAGLLAREKRRVITVGGTWTKSVRLPLTVSSVDTIVWFAMGRRRPLFEVLQRVPALGRKVADGYGKVGRWEVERIENDLSWFAESEQGSVLMRPLPFCNDLPMKLKGARRDYGAVCAPYWHQDRYCDRVAPCK